MAEVRSSTINSIAHMPSYLLLGHFQLDGEVEDPAQQFTNNTATYNSSFFSSGKRLGFVLLVRFSPRLTLRFSLNTVEIELYYIMLPELPHRALEFYVRYIVDPTLHRSTITIYLSCAVFCIDRCTAASLADTSSSSRGL